MRKARLISARVTARHGTFFAGASGSLLLGHPITLISYTTASSPSRARAYQVDCCHHPERKSVRLATGSCFTGASFQATQPAGFTSGGAVRNPETCTLQVRHFTTEPSDNFNLQRTSIFDSAPYPKPLNVRPDLMDSSAHHGNPGAPQTQSDSRSTEGPTAQQWQGVKEEIKELYTHKPLKDVRAILDQRYGFRATYVLPLPQPPRTMLVFQPPNKI